MVTCPRCGHELPAYIADADDDERTRARCCTTHELCTYVPCDLLSCRALNSPQTLEQWREAAEHWRTHHYLHGCSHGN
jgi:hypothetical protein